MLQDRLNFPTEEKLDVIKQMKFTDLVSFNKKWLINTRQEWFCYGNIIPHCSLQLAKKGEDLLTKARTKTSTISRVHLPNYRYFMIPPKQHMIFKTVLKNKKDFKPNNSGITMSFCQGKWTIRNELL